MSGERVFEFDIRAEIERFFDDTSLSKGIRPRIVIYTGGVAAGKTTLRKQQCATGYVVVDAVEIFLNLSRGGYYPFPEAFKEPMEIIGSLVARRAVRERRHIVTELVGADCEPVEALIKALRSVDYEVHVIGVTCDVDEAWRRNVERGDNAISAFYAEPFQRRWLVEAAAEARSATPD